MIMALNQILLLTYLLTYYVNCLFVYLTFFLLYFLPYTLFLMHLLPYALLPELSTLSRIDLFCFPAGRRRRRPDLTLSFFC